MIGVETKGAKDTRRTGVNELMGRVMDQAKRTRELAYFLEQRLAGSPPKTEGAGPESRKSFVNDPGTQPLFPFICGSAQDIFCVLEESNKVLDSLVTEL